MADWSDVYVHWTTRDFDPSISAGTVYTYKGLDKAFAALKQSFDSNKWKHRHPTPVFFDFSSIDFLMKEKRSDFFLNRDEMIRLGLIYNEKLTESSINEKAREAGKQGWAAKYDGTYDNIEYVVFNEYIESSMIIDGERKKAVIRSFIDFSKAEIERREAELNTCMDIDRWVSLTRYITKEPRNEQLERLYEANEIEETLSPSGEEKLKRFWHIAQRLTQSVRILSRYSGLPDDYFVLFLKYADYERDRIVPFSKFPTVFLKLRF